MRGKWGRGEGERFLGTGLRYGGRALVPPQEQRRIHWCAANFQASTSKSQFQRRGGISWPGLLAFPLSVPYLHGCCLFVPFFRLAASWFFASAAEFSFFLRLLWSGFLFFFFFTISGGTAVSPFLSRSLFAHAKVFRYVLKRCLPSLLFIQGGAE